MKTLIFNFACFDNQSVPKGYCNNNLGQNIVYFVQGVYAVKFFQFCGTIDYTAGLNVFIMQY